jgi:hypothetical protein
MSERTFTIDAATLDRLVDGELDRQAQRELFARLDDEPDGWRRLALAFVESQALGAELRGFGAPPRHEAEPTATASTRICESSRHAAALAWSRMLSLAASLLICVGVGFGAGRAWHGRMAKSDANPPGANTGIVQAGVGSAVGNENALAEDSGPLGVFTLPTRGGTPVQVPIYDVADRGEQALSTEPGVPDEVIRALRSRGHEVKQQRRYWPIDLGDGRQIIVPVDQLDVEYVGYQAYQ